MKRETAASPPTYTIDETNLERQHLLAAFFNPASINALKNISLKPNATILDVGCGLGDTTLMLHETFPNSLITGVDGDASLIAAARSEKKFHSNLSFDCGDALHLPFEDESFDFVFCRCVLHHIPDAFCAMLEMKRVCKRGGIVFAQEPNANSFQSYPDSYAYPLLKEMLNSLFADAQLGRKLISHFKALGLEDIAHYAHVTLLNHHSGLKKLHWMTAIAISKAILEKKLLSEERLEAWIKELKRIESDSDSVVLTSPIIAVWGTKR